MEPELATTLALLIATENAFVTVNRLTVAIRERGLSLATWCEMPPVQRTRFLLGGTWSHAEALVRVSSSDVASAQHLIENACARGNWVVASGSAAYPRCLAASLADAAPPLLFGEGEPALLGVPMAAVVGTRTPSELGVRAAMDCATWMTGQQAVVVSGGARGVDSVAHENALRQGGQTLVVLPQGLFTYVPPRPIAAGVAARRAVLISAFPPHAAWMSRAAVMRNPIISALARIVCVIEPHKEGGSIRTARSALAQGKPVFIAPAPDDPDVFARLRDVGARLLVSGDDSIDTSALSLAWRHRPIGKPQQVELFP